jgi:L-seryl-tRNA(Ser) seleniumtransferase
MGMAESTNEKLTSQQQALLRELPSMDRLLRLPVTIDLMAEYGRSLTLEALRATLDEQRTAVLAGAAYLPMTALMVQAAREWLEAWFTPTLRPVINATGVIIHTNLGRAPLSAAALGGGNGR